MIVSFSPELSVALSALSFVDVLLVEVCDCGVQMCLHVDRSVLGRNVRSAVMTVKSVAVLAFEIAVRVIVLIVRMVPVICLVIRWRKLLHTAATAVMLLNGSFGCDTGFL